MRRPAAVLALAAALLSVTSPATAAEVSLSEVRVDADVRSVDLIVSAKGLAAATGLDPTSVVATVDGRALPTTSAVSATQLDTKAPPRVLMVVDTSGSMAGQPMTDAKQAISTFVAQAPDQVALGLLTFSTAPRLVVPPTVDRARVLGAVAALQAQGETSLYDAVRAGLAALGTAGDRRLVVLSDGGDTRSASTLEQALAATSRSGIAVDAIGFNTEESVQDVLAQVAKTGGGRVHAAASTTDLTSALSSTVREYPTALSVRVLVPSDLRGPQTLSVSVSTPGGPLTTTAPVVLGLAPVAAAPIRSWWATDQALLVGLVAIAASLLLGSLVLLGGGDRQKRRTHEVLERFTSAPGAVKQDVRSASPVARTALELADRVATKRNLTDRSGLRLARAAVSMTPAEWLLMQTGLVFALVLVLVLLGWNLLLAGIAGVLLGVFGPARYLTFRGKRRQKAFEEKLPDALQMTAGSLSAGYSLAQALDGVVREGSEPMATELGRALAESRLGIPVETTLQGVAERMGSRDFGWVVMAIRVQREVGGNLAGVLTTVAATMRERAMLRRHVRALSAEGRLSAYILVGLPVSLALFMFTMRREYLEPLYTTGLGIALIAAALVLLSMGSFLMSRMVKVEV